MPDPALALLDRGQMLYSVVALDTGGQLQRPLIYGTAFCIGPGIFVTAGHVLSMIADDGGHAAVARLSDAGELQAAPSTSTEIIRSHDVGLIAALAEGMALLSWSDQPRSILSDVAAVGFPYAVTPRADAFIVTMRGFKGHVVTRTRTWQVPAEPVCYEVSCAFPKGMSGAPLLDATPPVPDLEVVGLVLGTGAVDALGETTRFGGLVLDILELANVRSDVIIGGTIDNWMSQRSTTCTRKTTLSVPRISRPSGRCG